ncbi:hypothetical protein DICVIV_12796 [Dictyocaulus viviparus]|uniref:Uncharacterized protein n=1 Tax=Dictyocaulus viviparus TaxID=29172 RepID=A0A0D8X9J2_DICVI|nr:hypothetical protein DICVIV_12796 [Dictyocaulus viviparus]
MDGLYEDCFVELDNYVLKIKNYYFPSKKAKIVNVDSIQVLWFEEQGENSCSPTKIWGKSSASIYWAFDVKRRNHHSSDGKYNIVIDVGQPIRHGFSVMNGDGFMEAIRYLLDYHTIIVDSINL